MKAIFGDCFDAMELLPDASIDMVLCDLPYGKTKNKWDIVLPLDRLWTEYRRVAKPNAAIVLTAAEPFMSALVCSNLRDFRYDLVWHKSRVVGHLNARRMPMRTHENIAVFYRKPPTYNPQLQEKPAKNIRPDRRRAATDNYGNFGEYAERTIPANRRYPQSVKTFNNPNPGEAGLHPTQKPVALFEYLIRTYTDEGMTVLDNTAGSGTTAIAARRCGRDAIVIERDPVYFDKMCDRIRAEGVDLDVDCA